LCFQFYVFSRVFVFTVLCILTRVCVSIAQLDVCFYCIILLFLSYLNGVHELYEQASYMYIFVFCSLKYMLISNI